MAGLWRIAIRDIGRNKRRSGATLMAMLLGVGLLVVTGGIVEGSYTGMIDDNVRVQTSHLQVRDADYERNEGTLKWEDLLDDADTVAARVRELPQVQDATPILWASGVLGLGEQSVNVAVNGMDFSSDVNAPFRDGVVAGQLPEPDDREGALMGRRLADSLGIGVGDSFSLLAPTSGEQPDEAVFTIRGLYDSGVPGYDLNTILMPLAKAQSFTRTGGRASAILTLLHDREQAGAVAAALQAPGLEVEIWQELNEFMLETTEIGRQFIYMLYVIVLAIVAVVIVNTLLMTVFERTREMGILASFGMKAREIRAMFLIEAGILALVGIVLGILLGSLGVEYLSRVGIHMGDTGAFASSSQMSIGEVIYAAHSVKDVIIVSVTALVITLLGSLYPAWYASRMEPIEALRAL
ncbi:MAG: ABC transporter permease [Anaerolineae bacterium]|nr:ABC transporter permease [Anaerolineae bacterium]